MTFLIIGLAVDDFHETFSTFIFWIRMTSLTNLSILFTFPIKDGLILKQSLKLNLNTLLAKITSYSNFLFGLPGFELNKLPIRSLPLVELIRTQEVLPRRFQVHVCGISAGSWDAFCFIFVASPLAHATLSGSSLWHLR